jgi:hypothetical protein
MNNCYTFLNVIYSSKYPITLNSFVGTTGKGYWTFQAGLKFPDLPFSQLTTHNSQLTTHNSTHNSQLTTYDLRLTTYDLRLTTWILDIGYWILDIGYWILDIGYWILDIGYWILDIGSVPEHAESRLKPEEGSLCLRVSSPGSYTPIWKYSKPSSAMRFLSNWLRPSKKTAWLSSFFISSKSGLLNSCHSVTRIRASAPLRASYLAST